MGSVNHILCRKEITLPRVVKLIALVLLHFWNKAMLEKVRKQCPRSIWEQWVKLYRKKTTFFGSFTVKVSYVKTWTFMEVFSSENGLYVKSLLARLLSWSSTFRLLEPESSIWDLFNGETVHLNKLLKFVFFKSYD